MSTSSRSTSRSASPRRKRGRSNSRSPPLRKHRRSLSPGTDFTRTRRSVSRDRDGQKSKYASHVVGVFNLSKHIDEPELEHIFRRYGRIVSVQIIRDHNNVGKGFGFVEFDKLRDAKEAKERMHGKNIDGRSIRTDYSFGKSNRRPVDQRYSDGRSARSDRYDRRSPDRGRYYDSRRDARRHSGSRRRDSRSRDRRSRSRDRHSRSRDRHSRSRDRRSRSRDPRSRSRDRRSRSRDRHSRLKDRQSRSKDRRSKSKDHGSKSRDDHSKSNDRPPLP